MGNKQFVLFMVIMLNHFQDASSQPSLSWAINLDFDADAEVPVRMITTSEIRIAVVIADEYVPQAVRAVKAAFDL